MITMTLQSLDTGKNYSVSFESYEFVVSSDIPFLLKKTPGQVWRYALAMRMSVRYEEFS